MESIDSAFPVSLRTIDGMAEFPRLWVIGSLRIIDRPLLGLFCSQHCPGDIILRTYDLIRMLRDAGAPVIGGFHTAMERDCLELLLRGKQPIVVCPAREFRGNSGDSLLISPKFGDTIPILLFWADSADIQY